MFSAWNNRLQVTSPAPIVGFKNSQWHTAPNQALRQRLALVHGFRRVAVFCERKRPDANLRAAIREIRFYVLRQRLGIRPCHIDIYFLRLTKPVEGIVERDSLSIFILQTFLYFTTSLQYGAPQDNTRGFYFRVLGIHACCRGIARIVKWARIRHASCAQDLETATPQ